MAAPADRNIKNLTGMWVVNSQLSGSTEPALLIQGIGYLIRKGISYATITITVNQYDAPPKEPNESTDIFTHIDIDQSASGLTGTKENRCLDDFPRSHTDWLFGTVEGRSKFVSLDEVEDEYLKKNWLMEGEGKNFIMSHVESKDADWTATQVWGFQEHNGERRYARNIVVQKPGERAEFSLIYDWYEEPELDVEEE